MEIQRDPSRESNVNAATSTEVGRQNGYTDQMIISDHFPEPEPYLELQLEEAAIHLLAYLKARESLRTKRTSNVVRKDICVEIAESFRTDRKTPYRDENALRSKIAEAFDYLNFNSLLAARPDQENVFDITSRGYEVSSAADLESSSLLRFFKNGQLHPSVINASSESFLRRDYEYAVFSALKSLEERVRKVSGLGSDRIGKDLMRTAFGNGGALFDPTEVKAEAEAIGHIFAGVIGYLKNPTSHRTVEHDPIEAMEQLFFVSWMHRQIDKRDPDLPSNE